ncbi:hypothetical protein JCM10450v2_007424 [Rhodotorula kratochvilovae]
MSGSSNRATARPAPATNPERRATTSGLFSSALAPSTGGRTPRASRAAVAAPHTIAPGTRIRSAVTPRPSSAKPVTARLVRTPADVRAQAGLRRGSAWRPSLMRGEVEAAQKIVERRELVRGPAAAALEELLMVGRDERAEENGDWLVGEAARTAVRAFESVKAAHLSSQDFLDVSSLSHVIPNELISPTSPINTLARLSNLTTFLHLVLTSAPDESGVADRAAVSNLKLASDALLRHVKPEEDPVDDQLLKLLVNLKCQAYLLASSLSRTPIDPAPYFSQTLRQLLPSSRANAMTDRGAAAKFQTLQSAAMSDIAATSGDWAALRTKWRWEDLAREARDWVDRCVQESGLAAGVGADAPASEEDAAELGPQTAFEAGDAGSEADDEDAAEAHRREKGKGRAPESDEDEFESVQEGEEEQDELAVAESEEAGEDTPNAEEIEVEQHIHEDDLAPTATVFQGRVDRLLYASSSSDDDDEIARNLTASVSPTIMRSMPRFSQPRSQEQVAPFAGAVAPPAGAPLAPQDSLPESQMTNRAESLLALGSLGHAESIVVEETLVVAHQSDRGDELFDFLNESLPPAARTNGAPRAAAPQDLAGGAVETDTPSNTPAQQPQQARGHLRFDGYNRLFVDKGSFKPHRSLLERQADARKISFDDSQSQPATPGMRPAQQRAPSPEAGRAAYESLPSPEPTGRLSEEIRAEAGPSTLPRQEVGMEPDFHQEFGGGFDGDEQHGAEAGELAEGLDAAAQDDGSAFAGFEEEDEEYEEDEEDEEDEGLPAPAKAFGAKPRAKKGKERAVAEEEEETLPTPPATTIQDRLRAFQASQPAPRAAEGDFDTPSESDGTSRRPAKGKSAKRGRASRTETITLPSTSAAGSASEDDDSSDGGSSSGESIRIVVPRRKASREPPVPHKKDKRGGGKKANKKGKKRAAEAILSPDDEASTPEPPRKKKKQDKQRRVRSPSPPLPQGAPGNNYFQGRNGPDLRIGWSPTETDLLIKLLKQFGCEWKSMMKLHGPNGTSTKTFAERTNVSLKDKAVNLALGYIRRGEPVPKYLGLVKVPQSKLPKKAPERVRANETDEESE